MKLHLKKFLGTTLVLATSFLSLWLGSLAHAADFTPFTTTMGSGSNNSSVTKLQTFLASEPNIYPEGRVTGYYGALTSAAVKQFQLNVGLPMVGRVGPLTLIELNKVNAKALSLDITAPTLSMPTSQVSGTNATISWTSNEAVQGAVYYSLDPILFSKLDEPSTGFIYPYMGGTLTPSNPNNWSSSHSVSLQGLARGTRYYFLVESLDMSGNLTITLPSTFITS